MSDEVQPIQRGYPLYIDPIDRGLPDPTNAKESDWYPATPPTGKLWRCYEAMQKLASVLEGMTADHSAQKQRRFLIQFAVPVCDFFRCIHDLTNAIESDAQTRSRLTDGELQYVRDLRTRFREAVLDEIQPLKAVRNKLGAHTDESLDPVEAQRLVDALDIHMLAAWLHAALLTLDKLSQLDCYSWTCAGDRPGQYKLINCEPFVVSLSTGETPDLLGIEMTVSPKRGVHERIADVVELSDWMFEVGQPRLLVKRAAAAGQLPQDESR